jgi:peptidoglycan hydrolase-like protein with peptidoglycan-binding domain
MSNVKRTDFLQSLANKSLDVATAQADARLSGTDLSRADLDQNGAIEGTTEGTRLFAQLDRFDHNGDASSVADTGVVAGMLKAIQDLARAPGGGTANRCQDAALSRVFPSGITSALTVGSKGPQVLAVQYTLGRLGHLTSLADGSFGARTAAAVTAFQQRCSMPADGVVDAATLRALDQAVTSTDLRTPAARAADPLAYLSDFTARGLTPVTVTDTSQPITWKHPQIQEAYSRFVGEYWPVLKENHLECDCKTLALFFMDQFRTKVARDTGTQLPLPRTARGAIPPASWNTMTAARPGGLFSRFENLPAIRAGYSNAVEIQKIDSRHSMIYGVNVRYAGANADAVSRAATEIGPWNPARDNAGDRTLAEVDVQSLKVGDLIFMDHTGDGKYDHTINVVGVQKDAQGKVSTVTLGVGSFDDMKDADGATAPNGLGEVNNYVEEVTISLNSAGRITGSNVTWSSEPGYVSQNRYSASNTLMEMRPNGTLKVGRWL